MDFLGHFLDILLKPPQPFIGLFLTLSQRVKVHLLFRYCIKNQSIGVAYGALLNLFWIFEYLTSEQFAGPLSVDSTDVQKVRQLFLAICILTPKQV